MGLSAETHLSSTFGPETRYLKKTCFNNNNFLSGNLKNARWENEAKWITKSFLLTFNNLHVVVAGRVRLRCRGGAELGRFAWFTFFSRFETGEIRKQTTATATTKTTRNQGPYTAKCFPSIRLPASAYDQYHAFSILWSQSQDSRSCWPKDFTGNLHRW